MNKYFQYATDRQNLATVSDLTASAGQQAYIHNSQPVTAGDICQSLGLYLGIRPITIAEPRTNSSNALLTLRVSRHLKQKKKPKNPQNKQTKKKLNNQSTKQ